MTAPLRFVFAASILLGSACHRKEADDMSDTSDSSDSSGADSADDLPGVLRLAPPAPAVGAYGIVAPPGSGRVYTSSLHVPFITVLSAETGEWLDAIDLRDGCSDFAYFPRLALYDDVIWVTDTLDDRLCRFDLRTDLWLEPMDIPQMTGAIYAAEDGVWVGAGAFLERHDRGGLVESIEVGDPIGALTVDEDHIATVVLGRVNVYDRGGVLQWSTEASNDTLQDIAIVSDRVFVSERETGDVIELGDVDLDGPGMDGAEKNRLHTGSDTFAVLAVDGVLYVSNRQGAALPASGTYEGAPGLITALTPDLDVIWTAAVQKTIHFLAWDGAWLWTANEDSLTVSGVDVTDGTERVRSDRIGLTIDHIDELDGVLYVGSHLTDEIWRIDPAGSATAAEVCGWPLVAVPLDGALHVPCQETGEVWTLDPDTLEVTSTEKIADSFFPPCPDGLCTSHDVLISGAVVNLDFVYTDGYAGSVRWLGSGASVDLGDFSDLDGFVQHFDVVAAPLGAGTIAFEPRTQTVYWIAGERVVATFPVTGTAADSPLVVDGSRIWVADLALNTELNVVATLPTGVIATASDGVHILGTDGDDLVVYSSADLSEVARLTVTELRVPPYLQTTNTLGPLRFKLVGDQLLVGNLMRGTIERRSWPTLDALGSDDVTPIGRWKDLPGLR